MASTKSTLRKPKARKSDPYAADIQKKFALLQQVQEHIQAQGGTQAEKAKALGISQPRLNDLIKGRTEKFSLDALIALAVKAGLRVDLKLQQVILPASRARRQMHLQKTPTVFAPLPSDLGSLDSIQATRLMLSLLRCEAIAAGLGMKDVVCSLNINQKDGGIDAKVEGVCTASSILASGDTYYQIKTGSTFRPWTSSSLKKELFGKAGALPQKSLLGKSVKNCLDKNCTYVLIVFGHDLTPQQHSDSLSLLEKLLHECGYANPKIEIYGQGQLVGAMDQYPSLCLDLIGLSDAEFLSLEGWRRNAQMRVGLYMGDKQEKFITEIRKVIAYEETQHIRIVGEPGVGKTRLVLEAVSDENFAPSVIYVPTGEDFQKSALFRELLKPERQYSATLVIDDCDNRDRASIWGALKGHSGIKLITIDHGPEESHDSAMKVFPCPPLSKDETQKILSSYLDGSTDLNNWTEWCEGSPRVAHAVGENLRSNPEDILKSPADVPIWDRFIVGHKTMDSRDAEQHRIVLRHISLFQKFGFEFPVNQEAEFICRFIQERADSMMTWGRFQEIIQHYRSKRILQGRHTLFIVPKALHVHLWVDFWNQHGRGFSFGNFLSRIPDSMKRWFLQLFTYAHASQPARDVVKQILDRDGPFSDEDFFMSETGMRFLNYLAEADPEKTLKLLEETIGTWRYGKIYSWDTGRQDIVWALEKLAVWEDLFVRTCHVLIKMAVAENANNSNNSTGILLNLFSIGLGWGPTMAPPSVRFPVLKELIVSQDESKRGLGFEMCKKWLGTQGGIRMLGAEYQGLRPTIEFWHPQTYGEVYDAWRTVLRLLHDEMQGFDTQARNNVANVMAEVARGLIRIENVADEVFQILFDLASDPAVEKKSLTRFVIWELKQSEEKLKISGRKRLEDLDRLLTGTSLWERTVRYVINSNWDEDYTFRSDEHRELKEPKRRVEKLAKEYMVDTEIFQEHLPSLMKASGHRLIHLGVECGKLARNAYFDEFIIGQIQPAVTNLNSEFLSGYLSGVRTFDPGRWEKLIYLLLESPIMRDIGVECMWRSGITEGLLEKLLALFENKEVTPRVFTGLAYLSDTAPVSDRLFQEVLISLLNYREEGAASICVELIHREYCEKNSVIELPEVLIFDALTAMTVSRGNNSTMESYYWHKVAERFLEKYPERNIELLENILINKDWLSRYGDSQYMLKVADKIVAKNPEKSWGVVSRLLESENENRFALINWLDESGFEDSKNASAVQYFPPEHVMAWVEQDRENRMRLVREVLPKSLDPQNGGTLTKLFIEEFCEDEHIARSLFVHFHVGGWSGPESEYLARKRDAARKWLSETTSAKVQTWLGKYMDYLNHRIENCQIQEEREF